jgi:SAM-dependent methyltransferase
MPRIRQDLIVTLVGNLQAYLRLDAGVGRGLPDADGPPRPGNSKAWNIGQRLQDYVRGLASSDTVKGLAGEPRQERPKRRRAESGLRQRGNDAAVSTAKGQTYTLSEPDDSITRLQIFRSLISPLKPGRMLDLGTGPGNFSLVAARLGWEVTAVDARTARMPDPEAQQDPDLAKVVRSIRWVESDVREFPIRGGEYDLICVLGLMHHLGVDDHIQLLKRCSGTLTLLDARTSPEVLDTEGPYEGRRRYEPGETREERDKVLTTSWGNETSFHHTEESLLRLVRDCGYSKMMTMRPAHDPNYTFHLCLPYPSR